MAPYHFTSGTAAEFAVFLLIGIAFGSILEMSGFGDSRKLAAQFYLREMTVLKVMFTAIVVAAVLIHLASALHWLDLERVWINPTYLWPGIVGGLIMGVGFIVGGFCPGTSLVAAATLKLDGVLFVLGGIFGVFAFGETVGRFDSWWRSSFFGRFTLADWLGIPTGVAVLALVLMALAMFVLAEAAERKFGGQKREKKRFGPARLGAAVLVAAAVAAALLGQPSVEDRWKWIEPRVGPELALRAAHVDPAEVVDLRRDLTVAVRILEVRSEADYNRFHLEGSRRIDLAELEDPALVRELRERPDDQILLLASNGERDAVEAWKRLRAQGVINLYIVAGGINGWLDAYPPCPCVASGRDDAGDAAPAAAAASPTPDGPRADWRARPDGRIDDERFAWDFLVSAGDRIPSAHPEVVRRDSVIDRHAPHHILAANEEPFWFDGRQARERSYTKKVVLQRKVVAKGGCG